MPYLSNQRIVGRVHVSQMNTTKMKQIKKEMPNVKMVFEPPYYLFYKVPQVKKEKLKPVSYHFEAKEHSRWANLQQGKSRRR